MQLFFYISLIIAFFDFLFKCYGIIWATKAYIYEEYKYLLTKNSRFIIEEPTISFDGIKNLGNIIKGNYLSLDYQEGEFSNKFLGISKKDLKKSLHAIKIDLISDNLNSINERSKNILQKYRNRKS